MIILVLVCGLRPGKATPPTVNHLLAVSDHRRGGCHGRPSVAPRERLVGEGCFFGDVGVELQHVVAAHHEVLQGVVARHAPPLGEEAPPLFSHVHQAVLDVQIGRVGRGPAHPSRAWCLHHLMCVKGGGVVKCEDDDGRGGSTRQISNEGPETFRAR